MEFPYTCRGVSVLRSVISEEKDKYLAKASLADLSKYIPDVDVAKNVDLLGIAFNIFVANRFNKNDDVSDSSTSVAIAKLFLHKPVNIEHKRDKVIGFVTNYAFTEFGSDKPLTEEEALASTAPFNVTLGGIVWRIVNQKLAKLIEECSDPTSEHYQKISASWEVGFLDFAIAAVEGDSKNLTEAKIITSEDEVKVLKGYMKAFGGKGFKGDTKLYRLIKGDALPLGVGLTGSPAADVTGVATEETVDEESILTQTEKDMKKTLDAKAETPAKELEIAQATLENNKSTKNISQNKEIVVIEERKQIAMSAKITKLEDITDDLLKQASASEITEFVKAQLKTADEQYQTEKSKLETEIKASKQTAENLAVAQTKLQEDMKKVNETLATLQAEKEARVKQDTFNSRMASLDGEFTLIDAEREVIAARIAGLDDIVFAAYKKELDVLLAAKKKGAACAKCGKGSCSCKDDKAAQDAKDAKDAKTAKAALEAKASTGDGTASVIAALENADKSKDNIVAAASAVEPTMLDKFAKAFGVDGWISDIKLSD